MLFSGSVWTSGTGSVQGLWDSGTLCRYFGHVQWHCVDKWDRQCAGTVGENGTVVHCVDILDMFSGSVWKSGTGKVQGLWEKVGQLFTV